MKPFRIAALCALLALPFTASWAATINQISVANLSSPNETIVIPDQRYREFATLAETPASAQQNGLTSTFTTRFAWVLGHRVTEAGASYPQLYSKTVAYTLEFQVDDPAGIGYTLNFDTIAGGIIAVEHEGNNSAFSPFVFASGTLMAANFSVDGGTPIPTTSLATPVDVVVANAATAYLEQPVEDIGAYAAGTFFGTHVFRLAFSTVAANATSGLANFNWGEATVRFGLSAQESAFEHAGYPTAGGAAASDHGHFVTVRVTSLLDDPVPVPEPGSWALAGLGVSLLAVRARFRRAAHRASALAKAA